jgi:protein-disulfide isomerase-like protein with CxxC motif
MAGLTQASGVRRLTIDIVSDTVCPWCYVGKRRLEKALSAAKHLSLEVQVRWGMAGGGGVATVPSPFTKL